MSLYRVSLLDILHSKDAPTDPNRILKVFIGLLCVANIAIASALVVTTELNGNFTFSAFLRCVLVSPLSGDSRAYFFHNVGDCFWVAVAQLVLFPLIAWGAVCSARISEGAEQGGQPSCCGCYRCFYRIGGWHRGESRKTRTQRTTRRYQKLDSQASDRSVPLLDEAEGDGHDGHDDEQLPGTVQRDAKAGDNDDDNDNDNDEDEDEDKDKDKVAPSLHGFEAEDKAQQTDTRQSDESYLSARSLAHARRSYWLALLFAVSTLMQCYLGLKCISFEFRDEATQVWLAIVIFD